MEGGTESQITQRSSFVILFVILQREITDRLTTVHAD
jgi:hypothetical protein